MTKKTYTVLRASIMMDGDEYKEGADIALEPGQAQDLLGTFVEEKATTVSSKAAPPAATPAVAASGKAKGSDGL